MAKRRGGMRGIFTTYPRLGGGNSQQSDFSIGNNHSNASGFLQVTGLARVTDASIHSQGSRFSKGLSRRPYLIFGKRKDGKGKIPSSIESQNLTVIEEKVQPSSPKSPQQQPPPIAMKESPPAPPGTILGIDPIASNQPPSPKQQVKSDVRDDDDTTQTTAKSMLTNEPVTPRVKRRNRYKRTPFSKQHTWLVEAQRAIAAARSDNLSIVMTDSGISDVFEGVKSADTDGSTFPHAASSGILSSTNGDVVEPDDASVDSIQILCDWLTCNERTHYKPKNPDLSGITIKALDHKPILKRPISPLTRRPKPYMRKGCYAT